MKNKRHGLRKGALISSFVFFLGFAPVAQAQVLTRINVTEDEVMNMMIRGSVKGRVTSVTYVQNQGSGFLLDVSFEGYRKHNELTFSGQLKKDGKTVGRIVVADHELGSESGQVRIALDIENGNSQGLIEADALVLIVEKGLPRQQYTFLFDKSWGANASTGTNSSEHGPVALVSIKPRRLNAAPVTLQFMKPTFAFMAHANQASAQTAQTTQTTQTSQAKGELIRAAGNTNKCFHTKEPNWNNGNGIHLWDCNVGPDRNKKWIYEPATGYIRSAANKNKCIHKKVNNWNNGNVIHLWDCKAGSESNKSWTYSASTKLIKARNKTDMCIHKAKPGWGNGNVLHLWKCSAGGNENKTWNIPVAPIDLSGLVMTGVIMEPTGGAVDTDAEGPDSSPVDLIEDLDNAIFENREFLGVRVFEDKNPASGKYYYLPYYYSLDWDASKDDRHKYGMEIVYDTGPDGQHIGMGMVLRASQSEQQIQFVRKILRARNSEFDSLTELSGITTATMSNTLTNLFGIAEEDIAVQKQPALNQVKIAWLTNSVAKESLASALTSQMGLDGSVVVSNSDAELQSFITPMLGHLATSRTYGRIDWDRTGGWENKTFHPVILRYMHAIKVGNDLSIDSWDLGTKRVPIGSRVKWDASEVPTNLEKDYAYVWFEYDVESCDQCDRKAVQAITGGTSDPQKVTVSVNVMTPVSSCGLAAGLIKIRSRNLRPDGSELETVDIAVSDQSSFEQEFYVLPEQAGQQIAEYQILGVQASGQMLQTNKWLPINDTVIYLGSHQVTELHGASVSCQ